MCTGGCYVCILIAKFKFANTNQEPFRQIYYMSKLPAKQAQTLSLFFTVIAPSPSSLPLGNIINAHHYGMPGWMVGISVSLSNDLLGSWVNYHNSHWQLCKERGRKQV